MAFASGFHSCRNHEYDQQTKQIQNGAFTSCAQVLNDVLDVGSAAGELCSIFRQHAQEPLPALVDKRDFIEVHDARASRIRAVIHLPSKP